MYKSFRMRLLISNLLLMGNSKTFFYHKVHKGFTQRTQKITKTGTLYALCPRVYFVISFLHFKDINQL